MQQLRVPLRHGEWGDSSEPHRAMGWHTESSLPAYVPALAQRGRLDPQAAPGGNWFCGVDETAGPLPLVWENHAAGLQPCLQQHPPAGHRDFSCKELFLSVMRSACMKGGSKDLSRLQMNCHTLR